MNEPPFECLQSLEDRRQLQKDIDNLDAKVTAIEKEIIKFKVHLFYFLLFLQVFVNPLSKRVFDYLFP